MHIRIMYYVTLPASIRAVNIANYVIIFGSHCPLYGSGVVTKKNCVPAPSLYHPGKGF